MYFSRNNALRKPATETEEKEETKTEVIGWKTDLFNDTKEENKISKEGKKEENKIIKEENKEENKISKEENTNARDDTKNIFNKEKEKNNEEVEVGTRDSKTLVLYIQHFLDNKFTERYGEL